MKLERNKQQINTTMQHHYDLGPVSQKLDDVDVESVAKQLPIAGCANADQLM